MLVEEELARVSPAGDTLLTIGVFDGVHLGHKHLIHKLLEQARQKSLIPGLVTFHQHPEDLLTHGKKLPFLTDIKTRIHLLKAEGISIVVPLSFTAQLARLDAKDFIELLQKHLRMCGLVIGPDFALGKNRQGDIGFLTDLGKEKNFSVTVVPPLMMDGEVVSSTAIRQAVAEGAMEKYHKLTGRSFSLRGKVVSGTGRGEGLGFPTANLNVSNGQAIPPDGVYASLAYVNGNMYEAMTNIGDNPTFGENKRTIESFILDYHSDLYGYEISVDFVSRIRDEIKFDSIDELKKQIAEDVHKGKNILDSVVDHNIEKR